MSAVTVIAAPVRSKLIGALSLLASNHDGERVAAACGIQRIVEAHGLRWDDIIVPPIGPPQKMAQAPQKQPARPSPRPSPIPARPIVPDHWRAIVLTCLARRDVPKTAWK